MHGSVSETDTRRKAPPSWARILEESDFSNEPPVLAFQNMDKKEINSPKMTLNFLIWVGGVFMLLLFAFLAHFVWRIL